MQRISWDEFKVKHGNYRKEFEELCYYLFCRKYNITDGIRADYNQVGLETYPIVDKDKKLVGFQAKFFDNRLSENSSKKQILDSLNKGKDKFPKLDKIVIFTHQSFGNENPKYKQEIEKTAGKIEIEWFLESNFNVVLNQPSNLDLAQLYFGYGDEFGFIKSSCDKQKLTLLNSVEYLNLPLIQNGGKQIADILSDSTKGILIIGTPGSGKSILMHKLLQITGGLNKKDLNEMKKVIEKNNALPMLVNFKDCSLESLENIIRDRQNDYQVRNNNNGATNFIYLLDGLDELNEERADYVLPYICRLIESTNTQKVVISCRSGNLNRTKTKIYIPNIVEYKIENLNEKYIDKYFKAKNNEEKIKKFKELKKKNPSLIKDINDVFLIKLLWDTIDELDSQSTTIDLLEKKTNFLLQAPDHKKNLEELNLLSPKEHEIDRLNQEISFEYQKKFQFRMSHRDIQFLILKHYPRLDYLSVNRILNYLSDLFFDNGSGGGNSSSTYIYQHRRYQEYFFTKKLKSEYEKRPQILRELKVLSNHEYFEKLFLKYLRKEYLSENNLPKLLELNLIDVYLGNNRGWGADDPYFLNSSEFIPSLANQNDFSLEQLLEDENLRLKEKLLIDINYVKDKFIEWNKDKKNRRVNEYLVGFWSSGASNLIENIKIFWEHDKKAFGKLLIENLQKLLDLFDKNKFLENIDLKNPLTDPFWKSIKSWIYYRVVIKSEKVDEVFEKLVRKNYKNLSENKNFPSEESSRETLLKSFFRVCLGDKKKELFALIDTFDEYEWLAFLDTLTGMDFILVFLEANSIHGKVKQFVSSYAHKNIESTRFILFYKRILNIPFTEAELEFANTKLEKLRNETRVD